MSNEILVTDSLFIYKAHEEQLRRKGYTIVRLDKPKASEAELCDAVKGKVGYILGGVETVTKPVIDAADRLRAIAFTGSGYSEFIPAFEAATKKGIAITAAIGGNAEAVAEYALAQMLMMVRRIPLLMSSGGASFLTAEEFEDVTVGIIGYGHVGRAVASKCVRLGFKVLATSRSKKSGSDGAVKFRTLEELVSNADVVSVHVDKLHGTNVLSDALVKKLKKGAAVVNVAFPHAIDEPALFQRVAEKEVFAAFDAPVEHLPSDLPIGYFVQSNAQTAFNTSRANQTISDMVVRSLLNVLTTGKDKYLVNPDYKKAVKR